MRYIEFIEDYSMAKGSVVRSRKIFGTVQLFSKQSYDNEIYINVQIKVIRVTETLYSGKEVITFPSPDCLQMIMGMGIPVLSVGTYGSMRILKIF